MFDLNEEAPDKVLHQLFFNLEKLKHDGDSFASEIQRRFFINILNAFANNLRDL